jgi:hypothetical protein
MLYSCLLLLLQRLILAMYILMPQDDYEDATDHQVLELVLAYLADPATLFSCSLVCKQAKAYVDASTTFRLATLLPGVLQSCCPRHRRQPAKHCRECERQRGMLQWLMSSARGAMSSAATAAAVLALGYNNKPALAIIPDDIVHLLAVGGECARNRWHALEGSWHVAVRHQPCRCTSAPPA